jgi:hypothetical protein
MTSSGVAKEMYVIDVIYQDGKFDTMQKRMVNSTVKRHRKNKKDGIGAVIDKAQLIDYESDTLYVLSTYYMPSASVSTIVIKTGEGVFM